MNIDKINDLKIGMIFKNYRELVAFFDEAVKTGNDKTYQLEHFNKYFDWEKRVNKFRITAIYDEPIDMMQYLAEYLYDNRPIMQKLAYNLEINKSYSYEQLCEIFHEPIESTNDKKYLQELNWKRFVNLKYDADSNTFAVIGKYDEPIEVYPVNSTGTGIVVNSTNDTDVDIDTDIDVTIDAPKVIYLNKIDRSRLKRKRA